MNEHQQTEALPLGAEAIPGADGYTISLAVRRENVRVTKRVVVAEEVVIRRHQVTDTKRISARARREEPRVEVEQHRTP